MPNPSVVTATVNLISFIQPGLTSHAVSSNGSVTAGDLMVLAIQINGTSAPPSAVVGPSGWSEWPGMTAGGVAIGSANVVIQIFWATAASTGAFSDTVSWTGSASHGVYLFFEVAGAGNSPSDGSAQLYFNASTTLPISPSATPTSGNLTDLLIGLLFDAVSVSPNDSITTPGAMTTIANKGGAIGGTMFFGSAYLALSSDAATSNQTWTLGLAENSEGVSLLIQPGPPPIFTGDTVIYTEVSEIYNVGTTVVGAGLIPISSAFTQLTMAWDITGHLAGNTSGCSMIADISLDGGLTLDPLDMNSAYPSTITRNQGQNPTSETGVPAGWCYMTLPLPPQVGSTQRQIQCSMIVTNAALTTAAQMEAQ